MKKVSLLLLISVLSAGSYAQEKGCIYILHKFVGEKIDKKERGFYNLFPYVEEFESAVFIGLNNDFYRAIVTLKQDEEIQFLFKDYTKDEIESISQRIENTGKMKSGKTALKINKAEAEELLFPETQKKYINKKDVEFTVSGNLGAVVDNNIGEETRYFSRLDAGVGYFINSTVEIGAKGTLSKTEGRKGSGGLHGTLALNIPSKLENVYYMVGIAGGFEIDEAYNKIKMKNVLDLDTQLQVFAGGKFFVSPRTAVILQPYYIRTFNKTPAKDTDSYGMSCGISLFF